MIQSMPAMDLTEPYDPQRCCASEYTFDRMFDVYCNTRVYVIQKLDKCSEKATIDLLALI